PPPAAMPGANACQYLNVTGNATVGTRRELAPIGRRSICRAFEAFLEDIEASVEHIPRNVERGNVSHRRIAAGEQDQAVLVRVLLPCGDRKSTRLNSSHVSISYAVFCLKKKKWVSSD